MLMWEDELFEACGINYRRVEGGFHPVVELYSVYDDLPRLS